MGLHTAFDLLSEIVERYERHGHTVRNVEAVSDEHGSLHATLELPVALDGDETGPALSVGTATMTDDGGFVVELSAGTPPLPEAVTAAVSVGEPSVRVTDRDEVVLAVTLVLDPGGDDDRRNAEATADVDAEDATEADEPLARGDDPVAEGGETHERTANGDGAGGNTDDEEAATETVDGLAAVRDDSLPPYEDTAYLQRLYDSCETFAEMSRRIEMDVAGETVRRYMIDAGVHTPTSYRTAREGDGQSETAADADADAGVDADGSEGTDAGSGTGAAAAGESESDPGTNEATPDGEPEDASASRAPGGVERVGPTPGEELVTDGIGLPDGLCIDDVVDAVAESSTVYEVQRELGLEQQRAWELLQQLGLLELLLGRIADGPQGAISHETVTGRIRQRIANSA
jgi:hypothetical protein